MAEEGIERKVLRAFLTLAREATERMLIRDIVHYAVREEKVPPKEAAELLVELFDTIHSPIKETEQKQTP